MVCLVWLISLFEKKISGKILAGKNQLGKRYSGEKTYRGKDLAGKRLQGEDLWGRDLAQPKHRLNKSVLARSPPLVGALSPK